VNEVLFLGIFIFNGFSIFSDFFICLASFSSSSSGGGGLADLLVNAVVNQVVNSSTDRAHEVSEQASHVLFLSNGQGLLNGPYKAKATE
jgi:hypothetical protein